MEIMLYQMVKISNVMFKIDLIVWKYSHIQDS